MAVIAVCQHMLTTTECQHKLTGMKSEVDNARRLGWSWPDIATRPGVTRQTAHRKHSKHAKRTWRP